MEEILLIEKYLRNELTVEERASFEANLAVDTDLREQFDLHLQALAAVRQQARAQMKVRLKDRWTADEFARQNSPYQWLSWVFVALLVLGGLGFWLWKRTPVVLPNAQEIPSNPIDTTRLKFPRTPMDTLPAGNEKIKTEEAPPQKSQDREKLYAVYFKPYSSDELNIQVRSEAGETPFTKFLQSYLDKDFRRALIDFAALSQEDQENENIQFLKANALLATNQARPATTILEKICAEKTSNYLVDAQWYLGLAYLRIGKIDEARATFQFIRSADAGKHPYSPQANKLLIEGF
jgi:tetratricopeptide (TPR) repeat protein